MKACPKSFALIIVIFVLSSCGGSGGSSTEYSLTSEVSGLAFPVRIEELASGKLLIAELASGNLSIYDRTLKTSKVIATFPISLENGIGISGLLVDQSFEDNGLIFVYHGESNSRRNILTRLTLVSEQVSKRETLISFAVVSGHNGGGMIQLDNGNIVLGTGDGGQPDSTQNLDSPNGKIFILNREGSIIKTNLALGLRNPFGITRIGQDIFALDNGPDCDDELNLVTENANFGWRNDYTCGEQNPSFSQPIFSWTKSEGTTDILFSENSAFGGKLLAARYNTKSISVLNYNGSTVTLEQELFANGPQGSLIDILETRDGEILLASQDGNIYRIVN